jgi:hypothetical protein
VTARFPTVETGGGGGGGAFHFHQGSASTTWAVVHNLGFFPDVQVFDTDGRQVEGDVTHNSTDQLTITFTAAFAGDAYCN